MCVSFATAEYNAVIDTLNYGFTKPHIVEQRTIEKNEKLELVTFEKRDVMDIPATWSTSPHNSSCRGTHLEYMDAAEMTAVLKIRSDNNKPNVKITISYPRSGDDKKNKVACVTELLFLSDCKLRFMLYSIAIRYCELVEGGTIRLRGVAYAKDGSLAYISERVERGDHESLPDLRARFFPHPAVPKEWIIPPCNRDTSLICIDDDIVTFYRKILIEGKAYVELRNTDQQRTLFVITITEFGKKKSPKRSMVVTTHSASIGKCISMGKGCVFVDNNGKKRIGVDHFCTAKRTPSLCIVQDSSDYTELGDNLYYKIPLHIAFWKSMKFPLPESLSTTRDVTETFEALDDAQKEDIITQLLVTQAPSFQKQICLDLMQYIHNRYLETAKKIRSRFTSERTVFLKFD